MANAAAPAAPSWVFVGDSLTAGLGVTPAQSWVAVMNRQFAAEGIKLNARNAGVSGDTSAGVLRRLDWILEGDVPVAFVAIGANDGLRGLPVSDLRDNLREIIRRVRKRGIRVLLAGMQMPPNYGEEYTREFAEAYGVVAKEMKVPLMPFLLDGVGGVAELNQADGIHPNADGHEVIAQRVAVWLRDGGHLDDKPTP